MSEIPQYTHQMVVLREPVCLTREWNQTSQAFDYRIESFTGWRLPVPSELAVSLWQYIAEQYGLDSDRNVSRET